MKICFNIGVHQEPNFKFMNFNKGYEGDICGEFHNNKLISLLIRKHVNAVLLDYGSLWSHQEKYITMMKIINQTCRLSENSSSMSSERKCNAAARSPSLFRTLWCCLTRR